MLNYLTSASLFLCVLLIKRLYDSSSKKCGRKSYFPGPKPLPLIGNAFDLPMSKATEVYVEWGKRYQSDIVFASAFGENVLILNKVEDADELLDRRARNYSSRPWIPVLRFLDWDWNFVFLPYGKLWRVHRQISQQNFRKKVAHQYHPVMLQKLNDLLHGLKEDGHNFERYFTTYSISIPMASMYGYDVKSPEDPIVLAADEGVLLAANLASPSGTWINVIPALGYIPPWFPGASASKTAARVRELHKKIVAFPLQYVKKALAEGVQNDSFVAKFLRKKQEYDVTEEEELAVRNVALTVYSGASDTTISALGSFVYLMAVNPSIQKKAQAEIDCVIGSGRLPSFEDRPSLPYIEAIYREVLRFRPPLPLGIPHAATEVDYYKGNVIPKGTTVISNIWAMTRDEELYPEPLSFRPERYVDNNGNLNSNDRILAYGFGRRICVGKHVASDTMWIAMACVLACFDIQRKKDDYGNDIDINDNYDDFGLVQHKSKFQCSFVLRSPVVAQLIERPKDNDD